MQRTAAKRPLAVKALNFQKTLPRDVEQRGARRGHSRCGQYFGSKLFGGEQVPPSLCDGIIFRSGKFHDHMPPDIGREFRLLAAGRRSGHVATFSGFGERRIQRTLDRDIVNMCRIRYTFILELMRVEIESLKERVSRI